MLFSFNCFGVKLGGGCSWSLHNMVMLLTISDEHLFFSYYSENQKKKKSMLITQKEHNFPGGAFFFASGQMFLVTSVTRTRVGSVLMRLIDFFCWCCAVTKLGQPTFACGSASTSFICIFYNSKCYFKAFFTE